MAAPIRRWSSRARAALGMAWLLSAGIPASAAQAQELPPPAYQLAAQQAGVPSPVLYAVALQESGAKLRGRLIPWPWTLNVAGQSERYASRAEACAGLRRALIRTPASRIDAGLGQVNLGYQAHRYAVPCELLDPYRNLAIAADILREQHLPGEDWLLAIGRYHRPAGGEAAARYRRSVHRHLTRVLGPGGALPSVSTTP
ncbi:lytic transglycosylase domain-containing protein [Pseudomonas aeruginosa]|nr:lytic transglycosylase domain-containing protein [Pseudomonas aeruginosa]NBK54235.1 lytic transglycosylase domain-containing protein [Pseudomonas aeruginosa]